MAKPSEVHIERYVRYPEELTDSEITWIENALSEDVELQLLADWFAVFYRQLDALESGFEEKPTVIELVPMAARGKKERRAFVLAAQSKRLKKGSIESVKTFVSEENRTLLRVLDHGDKKVTKIHILSDQIDETDIVLLQIPEDDLYLVCEPGGKLEIPSDEIDKRQVESWSSCRVLLPVMKTRVNRLNSQRDGYLAATSGSGVQSVEVVQGESHVTVITNEEQNQPAPGMLLLRSDEGSTLWKMEDGKATLPVEMFRDKEMGLFFYE